MIGDYSRSEGAGNAGNKKATQGSVAHLVNQND
jgi:hypothetical protein